MVIWFLVAVGEGQVDDAVQLQLAGIFPEDEGRRRQSGRAAAGRQERFAAIAVSNTHSFSKSIVNRIHLNTYKLVQY